MKSKRKVGILLGILFATGIFLLIDSVSVYAKEERHLIQTTTVQEEYEGLVHLELLATGENNNGNVAQSIRNVMPAVVQIKIGNYTGSGTIVKIGENSALIVSSRHVLQYQDFAYVRFYNGADASGRVVYLSGQYDIGFLEADISRWDYPSRMKLRQVMTDVSCAEKIKKGTEIFMVGSTDGAACNISEGTVADPWHYFDEFDSYMIYNYCRAKAGMSGGGTFDEHGHFVGMITGGHDEETASLPAQWIVRELDNYGRGKN